MARSRRPERSMLLVSIKAGFDLVSSSRSEWMGRPSSPSNSMVRAFVRQRRIRGSDAISGRNRCTSIDTTRVREVHPLRGVRSGSGEMAISGVFGRWIPAPESSLPHSLRAEYLAWLDPSLGRVQLGEGDQAAIGIEQSNLGFGEAEVGEIPEG